jgi:hypothetical protein
MMKTLRELAEPFVKIPLNPPLQKGDDNAFSPLAKGNEWGFGKNFDSIPRLSRWGGRGHVPVISYKSKEKKL